MCLPFHQSLFSLIPFEGGRAANGKLRPLGGGQLLCMGLRLGIYVIDLLIKVVFFLGRATWDSVCGVQAHRTGSQISSEFG